LQSSSTTDRTLYYWYVEKLSIMIYKPDSCNMDSMWSDSTLGIPKEVLAILAAIDGKPYGKAVWTLAKHRSGYSLKLFWGVDQSLP